MKLEAKICLAVFCLIPWLLYFLMRPVFHEDAGVTAIALIGAFWIVVSPLVSAIGMLMVYNEARKQATKEDSHDQR